jgi:hypothetical protein
MRLLMIAVLGLPGPHRVDPRPSYLILVGPLLGLALLAMPAAAFEASYQGRQLRTSSATGPLTWTCRAAYAANTGYYRGTGWTVTSEYTKQSRPATWIIAFHADNSVRVTDGQGNVGRYIVTRWEAAGVTLVEAEPGVSVQVITIDPSSSSFVYTTQHAQPLWNRAATFTGACE